MNVRLRSYHPLCCPCRKGSIVLQRDLLKKTGENWLKCCRISLEKVSRMRGDSFKRKAEDPRQTLRIKDRRQQKKITFS